MKISLERRRSLSSDARACASSLSWYLPALPVSGSEERRQRQAANESRRRSRRSDYQESHQVGSRSATVEVIDRELKEGLDRELLLRQCAAAKASQEGKRLHELLRRSGLIESVFLGNLLIQMYGSCGQPQEALELFESLKSPNVFSWNIVISACTQNGHLHKAKELFSRIPKRNVVTWNTMIAALVQNGHSEEALLLFEEIKDEPSKITLIHVLQACESLGALEKADKIRSTIVKLGWEADTILSTALLSVFAKHGNMHQARAIFDKMAHRDVVSWNSMVAAYARTGHLEEAMDLLLNMPIRNASSWNSVITAYVQSGHSEEAIELFKAMDLEGVQPSKITFLAVLGACTGSNSLALGKLVHNEMVDAGFVVDITAATALINMHGKCGSPETADSIFFQIPEHNCITWASLVAAYAYNGRGTEAIGFFNLMCLEGVSPNQIAFVSLLHACSHGGLLEFGLSFFESMVGDYSLEPIFDHYVCMVDLLGRTGRTKSAEELISEMPFEPDAMPWMVLLAACKIHHDVQRGTYAAQQILKLDPKRCAAYSLLAHTFCGSESRFIRE